MSNLFTLELQGGSSPLARGTLSRHRAQLLKLGLIPARAGNTWCSPARLIWRGAHPRSRGEHTRPMSLNLLSGGSSPLARGTQHAQKGTNPKTGLIPARAGNTRLPRSLTRCEWAHPRSRGEHEVSLSLMASRMGSSPLARGTLLKSGKTSQYAGLIPARAGNTKFGDFVAVEVWAHPRSRGEHACKNLRTPSRLGSSPLARGTLVPGNHLVDGVGLIPARAGNTFATVGVGSGARAHPRSRGEHCQSRQLWQLAMGSSPLARGTQPRG